MPSYDQKKFKEEYFNLKSKRCTNEEIAQHLGLSLRTLYYRVKKLKIEPVNPEVKIPDLPSDDLPTEELIDHITKRFEERRKSADAHTWFTIKVDTDQPIGVTWFGDPHLDDNGCDWTQLRRDIGNVTQTEGMYAANIGDTTNNWAGSLIRLYAEQDCSLKTAQQLASWFMLDSGLPWLFWLAGNHDQMAGYAVLREMAKRYGTHKLVLHDWEVRFKLKFKNGCEFKIFAAHDFKGNSIYNPMHGPMREGLMGEDADLYIAGHKHNAGLYNVENISRGHFQHFMRVRGYKFLDAHARRFGYKEQREGCAGVSIFDPQTGNLTTSLNVEEACEFLTFKRNASSSN